MVIPPYNWKEIFDKSQIVVFVWSLSGDVLFVSDSIRQFGYSPNEFFTKKVVFRDLVHPDDFDRIHHESHSFIQNKTDSIDIGPMIYWLSTSTLLWCCILEIG